MGSDPRTQQEIFDEIVGGLIKQGKPSLNEFWQCSYRGRDGTKCAAGQIIPDDKYDVGMENHFFSTTFYGQQNFAHQMLMFIEQLQSAHDGIFVSTTNGKEREAITDAQWLASFIEGAKHVSRRYHLEWKYD